MRAPAAATQRPPQTPPGSQPTGLSCCWPGHERCLSPSFRALHQRLAPASYNYPTCFEESVTVAQRITSTLSGQKEDFEVSGRPVRMYVCGMTPKYHPHVGHARV